MNTSVRYKSQKGAALLAFILIFLSFSSYSFIKKLNSNTVEHQRYVSSLNALNQAKAALIGYAIRFPEIDAQNGVDPIDGPGYLPCPDRTNPVSGIPADIGAAGTSCSLAGGTTIGRFPYKTLEMEKLRDAEGQVIWYAVSENYKNNPKVLAQLNSDSPGDFSIDGTGDIVAILFATGPPVAVQDRAADPLDVSNYLEDDNANGDNSFVTNAVGEFNDTVVVITRQELMAAVEKRVLGDIDEALSNYQTANDAYPWLSTFVEPSASTYRGAINTWQGHLPFHWAADPDSVEQGGVIANRNPFPTTVNITWDNIVGANTNVSNPWNFFGVTTVSAACLNDINDCDEGGIFPEITSLSPAADIDCTWTDKDTAECESFIVNAVGAFRPNVACPFGVINRTYTITYPTFSGTSSTVAPTNADVRRRNVSLNAADPNFIPAQNAAIQISDSLVNVYVFFGGFGCFGPFTMNNWNTASSTFDADTEGIIAINNMQYDLDIDDEELPEWFVENGWHELMYLTYASDEPLPGDTTAGQDCNSLGACLSININGSTNNLVRAAVLSAGIILAGQDRVVAPDETDYFDNVENTDADQVFLKNRTTTTYNDQTRIISTAP